MFHNDVKNPLFQSLQDTMIIISCRLNKTVQLKQLSVLYLILAYLFICILQLHCIVIENVMQNSRLIIKKIQIIDSSLTVILMT